MLRIISLFILVLLSFHTGFSQQLKGKITGNAGEPLQGISILLRGTYKGTSTNTEGKFSIRFPQPGSYTLDFQGVGYIPSEKTTTVD